MTLCEQVEAYLARFAGDEKSPEAAEGAKSVDAPAGTRAMVKAKDPLEDKYSLAGAKKVCLGVLAPYVPCSRSETP